MNVSEVEWVLCPQEITMEAATGNINGSEKEKSHFCACETPSALRATSPARRRCLPPDGQAMGSRAFDHKRIFSVVIVKRN